MRILCTLICLIALGGCAAPINPALWNPRPETLELAEDLEVKSPQLGGKLTVPKGTYVHWYSNNFGHFYREESIQIKHAYRMMLGTAKEDSFSGGLWLSNRIDGIFVYKLSTSEEMSKHAGELVVALAEREAGDTDGLWRIPVGTIPKEISLKIVTR